ncbi:hypothetical protein ACF0H5_015154 [Mactra antiquata]
MNALNVSPMEVDKDEVPLSQLPGPSLPGNGMDQVSPMNARKVSPMEVDYDDVGEQLQEPGNGMDQLPFIDFGINYRSSEGQEENGFARNIKPVYDGYSHDIGDQKSDYTDGEVKHTTPYALRHMAEKLHKIEKETGCIINETCYPIDSKYIPGEQFDILDELGRGAFGVVQLCRDTKTQGNFARKIIKETEFRADEAIIPTIFNHPNIIKLFGIIIRRDNTIELLLEYGGESLVKYAKGKKISPSEIPNLAKQGLAALKYMHSFYIIHGDIHAGNICMMEINGSLLLKLADFGTSRHLTDPLDLSRGPSKDLDAFNVIINNMLTSVQTSDIDVQK